MTTNWTQGFKPTSKGMSTPSAVVWNSDQCKECIDLRQALQDLATREYELRLAKEEIEQLQLEKLRLEEDLLQYTRGFTDFTENTNES